MTAPEVHAHEGHESHEGVVRCSWAEASQSERLYHDGEWGVPLRNERRFLRSAKGIVGHFITSTSPVSPIWRTAS